MGFPEWVKKGHQIIKCDHHKHYDTTRKLTVTDVSDTVFKAVNDYGDYYFVCLNDNSRILKATDTVVRDRKGDPVTYHRNRKAYEDYCEHKKLAHIVEQRIKAKGLSNISLEGLRKINAIIAVADADADGL